MYNPTRRVKRFRRPSSSIRSPYQLAESSDTYLNFVPGQEGPTGSSNHRHAAQPDMLRGAMLVALIVVTIILYFALWELERTSFVSLPKGNLTASLSSNSSQIASTQYQPAMGDWEDAPVFTLGEKSNLSDDRIVMPPNKPTLSAWPPRITRAPEDLGSTEKADDRAREGEISKLSLFDTTYCRGACRFLLPVRVGEQESKARVHFMQLLALAKRLNRTIVLPNVGNSRMGACSKWPFGAYYDTNAFVRGSDSSGSPLAIDLEEFAKWVDERPLAPNSFVVSVESMHQDRRGLLGALTHPEDVPFVVKRTEADPKSLSCLETKLGRLRSSLPETVLSISFDSGSLKPDSDVASRIVQLLSNSLGMGADSDFDLMMELGDPGYQYTPHYTNSSLVSLADLDVLVLDYDLRYPLFATSEPMLANFNLYYAPLLYDLADRLSENLGPFLGIHWRMENVPAQSLAWCAASLVSALRALLEDDATGEGIRHVWLATDHPRPLSSFARFPVDDDPTLNDIGSGMDGRSLRRYGPSRKSSTFKTLSVEHDDAIEILAEAFQPGGDLEAWKLTDLAEQLRRYPYVEGRLELSETLLGDSGIFGILDKLVIVQARVFVSGSQDCGKTSSFSKQVVEARQESFEGGKREIRNVIEYFGTR